MHPLLGLIEARNRPYSFNYSAIRLSRGVPVQGCVLIADAIVFCLSSDPTHLRQLGGPGHHLRQQRDEPA